MNRIRSAVAESFWATALSTLFLAGPAYAAPATPGPCANGDVTFRGSDADDCIGPITDNGNPEQTLLDAALAEWGDGFLFAAKSDANGGIGSVSGLTFTLTDVSEINGGTSDVEWTLTITGPAGTYILDLVASLKPGGESYAYLFNDETFVIPGGNSGTGEFSVPLNSKDVAQANSHMAIFFRLDRNELPEPGVLVLASAGLLGLALLKRRRMHQRCRGA
jgi:hypothetical protein